MMVNKAFLAFDLGAASGRSFAGQFDGERLSIKELSRFTNEMVSIHGSLYWDVLRIYQEIVRGLGLSTQEMGGEVASIGIDTWGVDFAFLGEDGELVGLPHAYRDQRTDGAPEGFFKLVSRDRVYQLTGIQVMPINTLYQLYSMVRRSSPALATAKSLLFLPDLFNYFLTGQRYVEFTIATTSQLYNPIAGNWAEEIFEALGLSVTLMLEMIQPGTVIGPLDVRLGEETGIGAPHVIATASHDTASAVAAVPAQGKEWAYLSSGTWSLVGVESDAPIITKESQELNFTNEGGIGNTYRVLKNITGLWLVQQCRQCWAKEREYSYNELIAMAESARGFSSIIEPNDLSFLNPPDMPEAIRDFCRKTSQEPPDSQGEMLWCIFASLALKYRQVIEQLKSIYRYPIKRLHVIGGGAQNELLCQLTADATGISVLAGPVEATVIGNILVQMLGAELIDSVEELREVVRNSFPIRHYEPEREEEMEEAYHRFESLDKRLSERGREL